MMETIKPTQYLGIWMNHSTAHLMEYTRDSMESESRELSELGIEEFVNKKLIRVSDLTDPF